MLSHVQNDVEVVVGLPQVVPPAVSLRGTILSTSYSFVREAGLEHKYKQRVPALLASRLPVDVALNWYPMGLAMAHYTIMEELFPDPSVQIQNGRKSSEVTQNPHLKTIMRGLSSAGPLNPMSLLKRTPRLFERMVEGGGIGVWQTGPKDARVELVGFPMIRMSYVRNGWQGMFESGVNLISRRCFVRQDEASQRDDRMAFNISWV